jgi:hypothetical protein
MFPGDPPGTEDPSEMPDEPDWVDQWNSADGPEDFIEMAETAGEIAGENFVEGFTKCDQMDIGNICIDIGAMGPKLVADCNGQDKYVLGADVTGVEVAGTPVGGFGFTDLWLGRHPPTDCFYWGSEEGNKCVKNCSPNAVETVEAQIAEEYKEAFEEGLEEGLEAGGEIVAAVAAFIGLMITLIIIAGTSLLVPTAG